MMRRRHRRFSRAAFLTIVAIGLLAVVSVLFVVFRTMPTASAAFRTVVQGANAACTCATAGASGGILGLGSGLFLLGSLALGSVVVRLGFVIVRTRRFARSFAPFPVSQKLARVARSLGLEVAVREVDGAKGEIFCSGMFRPRIYVSRAALAALTEGELKTVLHHEQFHLERLDPLRIALSDVLTIFLRWVPGLRALYQEYRTSIELAADETVIERREETPFLSAAILKLIPLRSGAPASVTGAVTFFSTTNRRIDELLEVGKIRRRSPLLIMAVLLGLSFTIGASAMSLRVGTLSAAERQTTVGQCRIVEHSCKVQAPLRTNWMSTEVRFASSQ